MSKLDAWMTCVPEKTDGKFDITGLNTRISLMKKFTDFIMEEDRKGKRKNPISTQKARQVIHFCGTYDEILDQIVQFVDVVGTRPQLELHETVAGLGDH